MAVKLQTHIPLRAAENQIDYDSRLLLLGSCFSENIGKKFEHFKFRSVQNPFGILFHPRAIENLISKAIDKEVYTENDVFLFNDRWHCFDAHSALSDVSKERLLEKLNDGLKRTEKQIRDSSHIIITLGSAWVYRHLEQNRVVSNCHKIPQSEFRKELLGIEEITKILNKTIEKLQYVNGKIEMIFTVSPVRHLKDGFIENQRSKAHLIAAIHDVLSLQVPRQRSAKASSINTSYFPSYEIMMDELRDYRFYEADMVHPNQIAVEYIWERFRTFWICKSAESIMEKVNEVQKGLQHRPFDADSELHLRFKKSLQEKITYLKQEYSFMQFEE